MVIDLDNTDRCPTGPACAGCGAGAGAGAGDLVVVTADSGMSGVLCLTLCPVCIDAEQTRPMVPVAAALAVAAHCEHLGIDLDQMAKAVGSGWDW